MCVEENNGNLTQRPDLNNYIEEADGRIIPHIAKAIIAGNKRIVVFSNDTDVVVFILYYIHEFIRLGAKEIWIRYGTGASTRYIPLHVLAVKLGEVKAKLVLKLHILSGCDVTSKVGTKLAVMRRDGKAELQSFGENNEKDEDFDNAERFLVKLIEAGSNCTTFNELRSTMYIKKNKSIIELPPTSNTIAFHLRRCYYFIRMCSSFLDDIEFNLSPLDYGWKRVDSVLYPIKGLVFHA